MCEFSAAQLFYYLNAILVYTQPQQRQGPHVHSIRNAGTTYKAFERFSRVPVNIP